jgi:hypothetical protein
MSNYPELDNIEIERLKRRIAELEIELTKAKSILQENDLMEDLPSIDDTEAICINEIRKLKLASDAGILTLEDIKILDLLHKNLLLARGKIVEDKKEKKRGVKTVAELLSIVDKSKK